MGQSKYQNALKELSKKPVFTAIESRSMGLPSRMLSHFCSKGEIERVSKGIYKFPDQDYDMDFQWEDLAIVALSIPNGVICLISALCYYELTDEIMREYWIAVPHSTTAPKRNNTRIVRMRNISLGQTRTRIGSVYLNIFNRERTVVDAFRYLDKEIALKALQAYLQTTKSHQPDIEKLISYGSMLRVNLTPYILAFTI